MELKTDAIGKSYAPVDYEVGREKIREYAHAVGEVNTIYTDREAARTSDFRDVVAPPMFCVVYSAQAVGAAITDPEVELNLAQMVHGGQEFVWGEPVCAGDTITTTAKVLDISEQGDKGFYVFESVSVNQGDVEVVRGTWTNIVRG